MSEFFVHNCLISIHVERPAGKHEQLVYAAELPKSSKGNGCQKSAEFLHGRMLKIKPHNRSS